MVYDLIDSEYMFIAAWMPLAAAGRRGRAWMLGGAQAVGR